MKWLSEVFQVWFLASLFFGALSAVTDFRLNTSGLIFGLPLLTLLIALDWRWPFLQMSTRSALDRIGKSEDRSELLLTANRVQTDQMVLRAWFRSSWLVMATCLGHLFGASLGREGVAVQLGNEMGSSPDRARVMVGVAFSIVFGAPFAAALFVWEMMGRNNSLLRSRAGLRKRGFTAVLILVLGSGTALFNAKFLHLSHFDPLFGAVRSDTLRSELWTFEWDWVLKSGAVAISLAVVSSVLVFVFRVTQSYFLKLTGRWRELKWLGCLRVFSVLLAVLGVLVLARLYSNGVTPLEGHGLDGRLYSVKWPLLFLSLKLILTACLTGIGLRGGEVTPLLACGLSLGLAIHNLVPELGGVPIALGLSLLWTADVKAPLTGAVLTLELSPSFLQSLELSQLLIFAALAYAASEISARLLSGLQVLQSSMLTRTPLS